MKGYRGTVAERMERKRTVDHATGCWIWHGAKDGKGYGQIRIDGKNRIATHVALELAGHPRTDERPCALHKCDNPACVNPDHLWWGTFRENTRDMMAKGRQNIDGFKIGHELSRASKQRPMVECANCGTVFETSKAQAQKNRRNFCSRSCCWGWQSAHFTGAPRGGIRSPNEAHAALCAAGAPCRGQMA